MDVKYDPILDKIRERDTGGGGGGGDYIAGTGINSVALGGGTVAVANIPQSAVTGLTDALAGKQPTISSGATLEINITGSAGSATTADELAPAALSTVKNVLTGGTTAVVDVSALRGALTAGQAVDVTSQPDGVASDWKGTFNWTDSYLGFDNSFPKYASGLSYLLIADLTYSSSLGGEYILVTPSGTWLDGSTTAIRIDDGETKRVAMIFSSKTGKLTVDSFDPGDHIEVNHLREYEVTACSDEAIAYIAALSNPDAFAAYYLVKQDMVQPWTYIIDMGTSPAVTIASGLSYKLNASTGTHQLTVDTCPAGYDGRDAIIRIRLGGTGVIQAVAPLQLGGALVPYAINNCVVRFRDGEAVLLVEDTLAGYVVTVNSGTGEGSLPYGLASTGVPYIAFSQSTDGIPVDLSGATTAAEEVAVVGNGYEETILTGSIICTSKTIVANLALSDVQIMGGTMTLGGAFVPSGSTVAVSGGGLAVEKVSGNGGTVNLGGTNIGNINAGKTAILDGVIITSGLSSGTNVQGGVFTAYGNVIANSCTFANCSATYGGAVALIKAGALVAFDNCIMSGNSTGYGTIFAQSGTLVINGGTYTGNIAANGGGCAVITNATVSASNVVISGNKASAGATAAAVNAFRMNNAGGKLYLDGGCTVDLIACSAGTLTFRGSNTVTSVYGAGSVTISSGATLDLTGNTNATPINPGGGISVVGGCTVINSAGASVSIAGGTYTKIKNDGTTA